MNDRDGITTIGLLRRIIASAKRGPKGYRINATDFDQLRGLLDGEFVEVGKRWRCFYCDDVFRNERDAAEHFGSELGAEPACKIKGHEHDLIRIIRDQERELARHRAEDTDLMRAFAGLRSEHDAALRRAEESGYAKGVKAMKDIAERQFGAEVYV